MNARRARVLYLISLATFLRTQAHVILSPALVSIRQDLAITTAMAGMTLSVYGLVLTFSQIGYGPLVDRFDGKVILLGGLALFTLSSLAAYAAPGIGWLLAWRALQALGVAAASAVGIALIADFFPASEQGRAMSVFESFNAIGGVSATAVGATIAAWWGWRADFLLLALLGGALLLLVVRYVPAHSAPAQRVGLAEMGAIARHPAAFGVVVLGFTVFFVVYSLLTLLPLLLSERFGLGQSGVGLVIALLPFFSIFGALRGGRMSDRGGPRLPLVLGTAGMGLSLLLLTFISALFAGSPSALLLTATVVAFSGFAMGMALPPQLKVMVALFPTLRGTAGALLYFARFGGATLAPLLAGFTNDALSLAASFGGTTALIVVGGVAGLFLYERTARAPESAA